MDKSSQRNQKTEKKMKLPIKLPPAAVLLRKEDEHQKVNKGYNGPGTRRNYHKGAFGKCKYLTAKEK